MARMYELTGEYARLLGELESCTADSDEDEIYAELEAVEGDISDKAENYARFIQNLESDVDAYSAEIQRLTDRKRAAENRIRRAKADLLAGMQGANMKKIQTSIGKWSVRTNPIRVEVEDMDKLPERFLIPQPPKVDKLAIRNEYKATGEMLEGLRYVQEASVQFR